MKVEVTRTLVEVACEIVQMDPLTAGNGTEAVANSDAELNHLGAGWYVNEGDFVAARDGLTGDQPDCWSRRGTTQMLDGTSRCVIQKRSDVICRMDLKTACEHQERRTAWPDEGS